MQDDGHSSAAVEASTTIAELLGEMLGVVADALRTLTSQAVKLECRDLEVATPSQLAAGLTGDCVVATGGLDLDYAGEVLRIVLPAGDAAALAGYAMMSPGEVIEARRAAGSIGDQDLEAFTEVANVLFSSLGSVLGGRVPGEVAVRAQHQVVLPQGGDATKLLGDAPLAMLPFELSIAGCEGAIHWLVLETKTAERWNGQPLDRGPARAEAAAAAPAGEASPPPIRGRLTAYLAVSEVAGELRSACRAIGLELDRRARTEVPHPAEHRESVVLIDVPAGDLRRFEWCKRLKLHASGVRVALLIHHPSRARVLQGFLANADAIMGWPLTAQELSRRLDTLLEQAAPSSG